MKRVMIYLYTALSLMQITIGPSKHTWVLDITVLGMDAFDTPPTLWTTLFGSKAFVNVVD